jgi:type II secretory pathway pseudopilin PulG
MAAKMTGTRRRALSLLEVVIGALILGISGVIVLELIRSSTVSTQVTEVEAVARGLAADVLERFSAEARGSGTAAGKVTESMTGVPLAWRDLVDDDGPLRYGFPRAELEKLLDFHDVRVILKGTANYDHPSFDTGFAMKALEVTVQWSDPIAPGAAPTRDVRTVSYACLLER